MYLKNYKIEEGFLCFVKIVEKKDIIFISIMMEDMYVMLVLALILHVLHVGSYMIRMILNMGMLEQENVYLVNKIAMMNNSIYEYCITV